MADNDQSNITDKSYDEMSRDELAEIIGMPDDPSISREELIMMAIEVEDEN